MPRSSLDLRPDLANLLFQSQYLRAPLRRPGQHQINHDCATAGDHSEKWRTESGNEANRQGDYQNERQAPTAFGDCLFARSFFQLFVQIRKLLLIKTERGVTNGINRWWRGRGRRRDHSRGHERCDKLSTIELCLPLAPKHHVYLAMPTMKDIRLTRWSELSPATRAFEHQEFIAHDEFADATS